MGVCVRAAVIAVSAPGPFGRTGGARGAGVRHRRHQEMLAAPRGAPDGRGGTAALLAAAAAAAFCAEPAAEYNARLRGAAP